MLLLLLFTDIIIFIVPVARRWGAVQLFVFVIRTQVRAVRRAAVCYGVFLCVVVVCTYYVMYACMLDSLLVGCRETNAIRVQYPPH